jgi:hypothetical protein
VKWIIALFLLALPPLLQTAAGAESSLVLAHVTVIDVESGTARPNKTVFNTGNHNV